MKLNKLIADLVNESLEETFGSLVESEAQRQASVGKKLKPFKHRDSAEEDLNDEQDEPVLPADRDEDAEIDATDGAVEMKVLTPEELQELDVETIIEEINKMRSGESLKDADIRAEISSYFDVLSQSERKMLFSFLQGLAQIMSFGAPGTKAARPSIYKLKAEEVVKSTDDQAPEPRSRQEKPSPTSQVKKKDTGPAPIVVGEVADKRSVKRRLRELMKR